MDIIHLVISSLAAPHGVLGGLQLVPLKLAVGGLGETQRVEEAEWQWLTICRTDE